MTPPRRRAESSAQDAARSHLAYWLYGITKTASKLGNARLFLREAQEESIRKFLAEGRLPFQVQSDPVEILRAYNAALAARGVLDASDIQYAATGGRIDLTIGATCPYRGACDLLQEDGIPPPCFRAISMASVLRFVTRRGYTCGLTEFGVPCHLSLKPSPLEAADGS